MTAEVHAYVTGEQIMVKHLLETSGKLQGRRAQATALAQRAATGLTMPAIHPGTEQFLTKVARQTLITGATHQLSINAMQFGTLPAHPILEKHIAAARDFTGKLLDINLDDVEVVVVPQEEWDVPVAEGVTYYYAANQHLVFVPPTFTAPTELLCHELGHAAHATGRRRTEELPFYVGLAVTEELVSHFSQFNYILAHGTRREFVEALGALTTASFAVAIWGTQDQAKDRDAFMATRHAGEFLKAIPDYNLIYQYQQFAQYQHEFIGQLHRGVGMLLALLLVDEHEGMRRFIALDRVDHSLADKLAATFPGVDLDAALAQINERIASLVARFAD
jgi:hypothetical protein